MPFKTSRDSSALSGRRTSLSSPQEPVRKVLIEDEELLLRVRNNRPAEALKRALTSPVESWGCRKRSPSVRLGPSAEDFTFSSRIIGESYEVVTVGDIACSPQELASILCTRDESDYNAVMKGIYDKQFIYGSIVHILDGKEAQEQLLWMPESHQLTVKTGCFTRSKLLARNEQWCFLEYFQPTSSNASEGFSVALLSLPEKELSKDTTQSVWGQMDFIVLDQP